MDTKTITMHVSDMDEQEIAAGQAYQLTIRHPDGSTQQLDISAQNYKGLKIEGHGKMAKKRGRKPGSGTAKPPPGPPAPADVRAGRPMAPPNLPPPEKIHAVLSES